MSSSQWHVRLTCAEVGLTAYGLCAQILQGDLMLTQPFVSERLESSGVDGVRVRRRHRRPKTLVIRMTEPLAPGGTYALAEEDYGTMIARSATFEIVSAGVVYRWRNAVIEDVAIVERTGALTGFGEVTGSTRSIVADWTILRVEDAE